MEINEELNEKVTNILERLKYENKKSNSMIHEFNEKVKYIKDIHLKFQFYYGSKDFIIFIPTEIFTGISNLFNVNRGWRISWDEVDYGYLTPRGFQTTIDENNLIEFVSNFDFILDEYLKMVENKQTEMWYRKNHGFNGYFCF